MEKPLPSAQVYSENIVGYNTVVLKPGFNMIAPSFDAVGGGAMDLQDVVPGTTTGLKAGADIGSADNIQIWNASTLEYSVYFLHDGSGKNNTAKASKWVVNNEDADVATDVNVTAQSGFFYVNNGTTDIEVQIAGQVIAPNPANTSIPLGFSMLASPYTYDWYINNDAGGGSVAIVDWATSAAKKGADIGSSDNIQIWDTQNLKYNVYFLHDGSGKNNTAKANKWVVNNDDADIASGVFIKAGQGFFYVNNGGSVLTLNTVNPYTFD